MFKRTWIVVLGVLAFVWLLSACGGGDLAEDLTPIPTLPPGEEPELVEALQVTPEPVAADAAADGEELSQDELVALGETAFAQCAGCHGAEPGAGPALPSMGANAATRVEGMNAEDYLYEAIVEPGAYVVEGYGNIMPADYGESLSEQEVQGLVAYILAESGDVEDATGDEMDSDTDGEAAADDAETEEATEDAAEDTSDDEAAEEAGGDEAGEADADADDTAGDETEDADAAAEDDAEAASIEGNPANGETLFVQACVACHGAEAGVGPALTGMGERAAGRVEGQSAEEYLYESVVDPGAYIVEGYTANIMPPTYSEQYSEQEIWDIVAYMLTQ